MASFVTRVGLSILGGSTWEEETKLLDRKRANYRPHVDRRRYVDVLDSASANNGAAEPQTYFSRYVGARHLIERGANWYPAWLRDDGLIGEMDGPTQLRPNLSRAAQSYLDRLGLVVEDMFHHFFVRAPCPRLSRGQRRGPAYGVAAHPEIRAWPEGDADGAAGELAVSAARGRELAALLDSDTPVPGVTEGSLCPEIAYVAVPSTVDGGNMAGDDLALTASWGHYGQGEAVMPGQGRVVERPCTTDERAALGGAVSTLGETTFDIYLNDRAYWRNVPDTVWSYKLKGYKVAREVPVVPGAKGPRQGAPAGGGAALDLTRLGGLRRFYW